MIVEFYKYQGTGNDFVMIDDRSSSLDIGDVSWIRKLCHRRFGIGADGIILLRNHEGYDFHMHYFNADGSQSMCGNGARCALAFASFLGIFKGQAHFLAIDGPHQGIIRNGLVELKMGDVGHLLPKGEEWYVDTGSPHHIRFVDKVDNYPVVVEGSKIRYSEDYPLGTNVNFVERKNEAEIMVRTYERGVEDETFSCGTGVTACALVHGSLFKSNTVRIGTLGGTLKVTFQPQGNGSYKDIWLIGPAEQVFSGKVNLEKMAMSIA
ncbi:diaminopimelate epimerase [Pleomorphovibrio marinus]|uniref:diaminopimelate epimerase n=1 Tax=Pleomorphovibrio marinus TaxID=2164132 RepID=UPI000E0B1C65|nr:diaminopimelate epimerase [Pleomorphovibrio marinus]